VRKNFSFFRVYDAWGAGNGGSPAESPDRQEVVWIHGESRSSTISRFLFIQRDTYGNFTGFAPSLLPDDDGEVSGRFSGFLPQHEVTDKEALAARYLMQTMGADVRQPNSEPQLN
jgi:hypothetical protein